jgi:WS/DGAT/MGAT family acyltransferase
LSPSPEAVIEETPAWVPRPVPTPLELLRDTVSRGLSLPGELARGAREVVDATEQGRQQLIETLGGLWKTLSTSLPLPADTPLNRPIGPHRRFDWLKLDLAEVKEVKNHLGGTVNDVVLATVAGGVRRFLQHRGVDPEGLVYRVTVPVNTRSGEDRGVMGNRVSALLAQLPIDERDPRRRFARVREMTASLKEAKQAQGIGALIRAADWVGKVPLTLGVRFTAWLHPYNLIVSNVPGPPIPLYLLGAEMIEGFPLVPLFTNQGLGLAMFSYVDKLCWGLNADWDLVPDLDEFVKAILTSFDELRRVTKRRPARGKRLPGKRAGRRVA